MDLLIQATAPGHFIAVCHELKNTGCLRAYSMRGANFCEAVAALVSTWDCMESLLCMCRLVKAMVAASPKVRPDWSVEDGVVRISMLHYNTPEEVDHVIQALGEVLS